MGGLKHKHSVVRVDGVRDRICTRLKESLFSFVVSYRAVNARKGGSEAEGGGTRLRRLTWVERLD